MADSCNCTPTPVDCAISVTELVTPPRDPEIYLAPFFRHGNPGLRSISLGEPLRRASPPGKLVQRRAQPLETGAEIFRLAADPESEMSGRLEERTGHDRGLVFLAQQLEEHFRFTARQAWKDDRARGRTKAFQVGARIQKRIK